MADNHYTLRIEGFTPTTISMARLADYMAALADLLGSQPQTHFDGLVEGSAQIIARVEERENVRVDTRVASVGTGTLPAVEKAFAAIDDLLANDNTKGQMIGPEGAVVVTFPGVTRPKPLVFPAFRQSGSIDGEVVKLGGQDKTAHLMLEDGDITYSNIELGRETAKALATHLYGRKVRLFGSGRWERHPDGAWKLLKFNVDRFEVLDDAPLDRVLDDIRRAAPNLDGTLYDEVLSLRNGEEGTH